MCGSRVYIMYSCQWVKRSKDCHKVLQHPGQINQPPAIHVINGVCRRIGDGLLMHVRDHPGGSHGNGRTSMLQKHAMIALHPSSSVVYTEGISKTPSSMSGNGYTPLQAPDCGPLRRPGLPHRWSPELPQCADASPGCVKYEVLGHELLRGYLAVQKNDLVTKTALLKGVDR